MTYIHRANFGRFSTRAHAAQGAGEEIVRLPPGAPKAVPQPVPVSEPTGDEDSKSEK